MKFLDGLVNVVNQITNRRNVQATNIIRRNKMADDEMRALLVTGLGSKIVRLKIGYALNDTLVFEDDTQKELYNRHLKRAVNRAAKFALAFGRGIIVMNERGETLNTPRTRPVDMTKTRFSVFSGDMVTPLEVSIDLNDARYMKPKFYSVNGYQFHYTRVIDFTYVEPAEQDAALYKYGGVSEFELIRNQIINDGIVERASGAIVEKNATVFHKIKGFKESLAAGQDKELIDYYSILADLRSIHGDGIIDSEDDVISVAQALTNLADVDQITLRRLALVTGIPLTVLVGEAVKGLNASGEKERQTFQDTIENLQFDYLLDPIVDLTSACGMGAVEFAENQGGSALERVEFETKAIANAKALWEMGEDYRRYLRNNELLQKDPFAEMFPDD
jgi:hypothetical protein